MYLTFFDRLLYSGFMKNKIFLWEQSLVTFAVFGLIGGFLESYTFVLHGNVFCNAQTGNLVLLVINLIDGKAAEILIFHSRLRRGYPALGRHPPKDQSDQPLDVYDLFGDLSARRARVHPLFRIELLCPHHRGVSVRRTVQHLHALPRRGDQHHVLHQQFKADDAASL